MNRKWFEKRGTLLTLVYLHNIGKSNQKAIHEAIKITNDTLRDSVIPELEKQKLIITESQNDFPFSTDIELTEKGKEIAAKLAKIGIFTYP